MMIAMFIVGCSSGVTRPQSPQKTTLRLSTAKPVSSVVISLTDQAKQKHPENLKFNPEQLLAHVKRALESQSLLKDKSNPSKLILEISVKDMYVRSNFSAIAFGFMAGSDSITGDIVLRDGNRELDRFEVSVSYALGGLGGGQDETRMSWLYEKFAEETIKELIK